MIVVGLEVQVAPSIGKGKIHRAAPNRERKVTSCARGIGRLAKAKSKGGHSRGCHIESCLGGRRDCRNPDRW